MARKQKGTPLRGESIVRRGGVILHFTDGKLIVVPAGTKIIRVERDALLAAEGISGDTDDRAIRICTEDLRAVEILPQKRAVGLVT